MENEHLEQDPEQIPDTEEINETPTYVPRPAWQVWGARICLVLFLLLILMYYLNIARGGL